MQLSLPLEWSAPRPAPANSTMPWSEADYGRLADLYVETGGDIRAIAALMGRSATAVWTKASNLGLAVTGNDVRLRKCLGDGCRGQKLFMSPDKGTRICPRCKGDRHLPWGVY
ncbi:hypothetical protein QIH77_03245 [Bradyrhizobium diazoefficiens]|uniref:hypothetical protein n=1 Tax=Bradyrhizobium diazoefficiens TaxID=1355477 RepID=UPI00272D9CF6|nr:hypothetical protein [Bradyrhizobium diazoefficiens]WLA74263.1 hypothetical protein QIH77_03245 [Bradyrhizobium diazoefficiens]